MCNLNKWKQSYIKHKQQQPYALTQYEKLAPTDTKVPENKLPSPNKIYRNVVRCIPHFTLHNTVSPSRTSCWIFSPATHHTKFSDILTLHNFLWTVRRAWQMNSCSHHSHWYGLWLVWSRLCIVRVAWWVNALLHISHLNGRSPVWTRRCCLRLQLLIKAFPQMSHILVFSPVWILQWNLRCSLELKDLPQTSQI